MTAKYKLLQPHYIQNVYLDQGITVTEGTEVPSGWVPTLNVDPLNTAAVTAFYSAGPRGLGWEELNQFGQQNYTSPTGVTAPGFIKPATYWIKTGGGFSSGFSPGFVQNAFYWQLTGLGVLLAPIPAV